MALYDLDGVKPSTPESGNYWVAENATVLGRVILKENARVWFNAVLRGDNDPIEIGDQFRVAARSTDPCEIALEDAEHVGGPLIISGQDLRGGGGPAVAGARTE